MRKTEKQTFLDEIRKDFLSGLSSYDIRNKIKYRKYESMEEYQASDKTYIECMNEAYHTCKIENEGERQRQRELMYSRFLELYREAKERHDHNGACKVLDSMSKLLGLNDADKIEVTNTVYTIKMV